VQNPVECNFDVKCMVHLHMEGKRDSLRDYAGARGIQFTGEVYFMGVHAMPSYDHDEISLPVTGHVCANYVCPPLYPEMSEQDVAYVCEVMNQYFSESTQ